jgi:DNA-binding response OmpR family regulator
VARYYYTDLTRVQVRERGFHGYLPKPYRVDTLVASLAEFRKQVN